MTSRNLQQSKLKIVESVVRHANVNNIGMHADLFSMTQ